MPATDHPSRRITVAEVTVIPALIRTGDVFPGPNGWTAMTDAVDVWDGWAVDVIYTRDGGMGTRQWPTGAPPITVTRRIPR